MRIIVRKQEFRVRGRGTGTVLCEHREEGVWQRAASDKEEPASSLAGELVGGSLRSTERRLRALLSLGSSLQTTELVCSWALSPLASQREAVARALSKSPRLVGAPSAITYLQEDPVEQVRRAARHTAALWQSSGQPQPCRDEDYPQSGAAVLLPLSQCAV